MDQIINVLARNGLSDLLNFTQAFVALIDSSSVLLEWNPAFGQMLNRLPSSEAWLLPNLLAAASRPRFNEMMLALQPCRDNLQLLFEEEGFDFDCLLTSLPDGNYLFFAQPVGKSHDHELMRLTREINNLKHILDIKKIELEAVLVQAYEVSHTDALTFLANRKQIIADLQREVIACERYRKPFTIFMLDIDHFKHVNDSFGHAEGDKALIEMSAEMLKGIRHADKLGRYGGEEFLLLLPATALKSAITLADRLLTIAREKTIHLENDQNIRLTISIGIAQIRIGKESWDELLRRADKALYMSKANGRDQWTVLNYSDNGIISSRSALSRSLHRKE